VAAVDGEIRSAALTNAETSSAAMIGGVFTRPNARGQGLSQAVMSAISAELLALGKTPTLYWVNPAAGAVYGKLGFHPVGRWRAVRLEKMRG
jgi:predicted GNAT family acetyltransferase